MNEIEANGNLNLNVGGDIADAGNTGLGDTMDDLTAAQQALTEAERELTEKSTAAGYAEKAKEAADSTLAEAIENKRLAEEALEQANNDLTQAQADLGTAQQAYDEALANLDETDRTSVKALEDAQKALEDAQAAVDEANEAVTAWQTEVDATPQAVENATQAVTDAQAALEQAEADKEEARKIRDHAAETLQYAGDLLDAQRDYVNALHDEAATDLEKTVLATQVGAEEVLRDAYKDYVALAEDKNADPAAVAAAEEAVNVALQAVEETRTALQVLRNETAAEQALAEAQNAAAAAEDERALAEQNLNEAADAVAEAQSELDAAVTDRQIREAQAKLDEAVEAQTEAQAALDEATDAKNKADQNVADAEDALEKAKAETELVNKLEDRMNRAADSGNTAESQQKANDALAAAKQLLEAQLAEDAAEADEKAAMKVLREATDAKNEAEQQLRTAEETLGIAEQTLSDAEALAQQAEDALNALDDTATNAERREAQKNLEEANAALEEARNAAQQAADEKAQAQDTFNAAENRLGSAITAEAETARKLADAQAVRADAETNAQAAADAADKQSAKEAAQQKLADAQEEQNQVANLIQELANANEEMEREQAQRDRDRDSYNRSNTGKDTAQKGLEDTTRKSDTLDKQNNTLADKQAAVKAIEEQLAAITGTSDPEQARTAAQQKVTQAQNDLNAATNASNTADAAVDRNAIKPDVPGASAVRADDAKPGDAAIRVSGDASITSGGSMGGQNGQELTMNVDGVTDIKAANDVKLQSGEDVTLKNLTAGGSVGVTGHGDITGTGSDPVITGTDVALNAVSTGDENSTIGKADGKPLTLDTDELSLRGDDVDVTLPGGVTLGDIIAENVGIKADGDVTRKEGTQIDASDLTIRTSGNVGTEEDPIVTNVDTITATGKDVFIDNRSESLTVKEIKGNTVGINAAGSLDTTPDGSITAHDLTIRAGYDVGTKENPINVHVSGKLDVTSIWGDTYVHASGWRILEDEASLIKVQGEFAETARLVVLNTAHYAMQAYPELEEQYSCGEELKVYSDHCLAAANPEIYQALIDGTENDTCRMLWTLVRDHRAINDFVLGIFSEEEYVCNSKMYFEISLIGLNSTYDGQLEGEMLYMLLCVAGKLVSVPVQVQDGMLHFDLDRLGMDKANYGFTPFVIVRSDVFNGLMTEKGDVSTGSKAQAVDGMVNN